MISIGIYSTDFIEKNHIYNLLNDYLKNNLEALQFLSEINLSMINSNDEISNKQIIVLGLDNQIEVNIKFLSDFNIDIFIYSTEDLTISEIFTYAEKGVSNFLFSSQQSDWINKIALYQRKKIKPRKGKLILVDSIKHGLGVTSVVAGVSEYLSKFGKTLAIDLDYYSQDLSRFLQSKPFINEIFSNVLLEQIDVNIEVLEECTNQIWEGEDFYLLSAPLFDLNTNELEKVFITSLELFLNSYEYVVVDCANLSKEFIQKIKKYSDLVLNLISPDPSKLIASIKYFNEQVDKKKVIIINNQMQDGLSESELKKHFNHEAFYSLDYSVKASIWLASGFTIYSYGNKKIKKTIEMICNDLINTKNKSENKQIVSKQKQIEYHEVSEFVKPVWT